MPRGGAGRGQGRKPSPNRPHETLRLVVPVQSELERQIILNLTPEERRERLLDDGNTAPKKDTAT